MHREQELGARAQRAFSQLDELDRSIDQSRTFRDPSLWADLPLETWLILAKRRLLCRLKRNILNSHLKSNPDARPALLAGTAPLPAYQALFQAVSAAADLAILLGV